MKTLKPQVIISHYFELRSKRLRYCYNKSSW